MNNKKSNNISNSMLKIRIKESLKDYAFQPFVFLGKKNSNLLNFYLIYMCVVGVKFPIIQRALGPL